MRRAERPPIRRIALKISRTESDKGTFMQVIVDPRFVDRIADELVMLGIEIENSRAFVSEVIRAKDHGEVLRRAAEQLAGYQESQENLATSIRDIAQEFGVHCTSSDYYVLVGKGWIIHAKDNTVNLIPCATAQPTTQEQK
jgi:hypothetical protein